MRILNFKLFNEARLSDISIIKGTGVTFSDQEIINTDNFIKNKTISKRIDNKKIRLDINWNHTIKHDLIKRFKERTSLKNITELNTLISKGLDELFINNYDYIKNNGKYSLWFSEYNFTIIVDISNNLNINIITILPGQKTINVKNIIELKTKI